MSKPTVIEVPILNNEYWVYVVWGDGSIKWLRQHFDDKHLSDECGFRARTFNAINHDINPAIYMVIKPTDKHFWGTLAHEACHAVAEIWKMIGEQSYDEAYSHSVGAVVNAVEKKLRIKPSIRKDL